MTSDANDVWLEAIRETVDSYRRMVDGIIGQLSDEELRVRPAQGVNSVAVLLRHLGGNLKSRWTDFLTTDGEKDDRDRDAEFEDWAGDRQSLLEHFNDGWTALTSAISALDKTSISQPLFIRGEQHSIPLAVERSITHLTWHLGQIALIARLVHQGEWRWLTIAPGQSARHNERTWGRKSSRSVFTDGESGE